MKNVSEVTTVILGKDHIHKVHISNLRYVYTFNQLLLICMEKLNLEYFVIDIPILRKQNYEMVLRVKVFH